LPNGGLAQGFAGDQWARRRRVCSTNRDIERAIRLSFLLPDRPGIGVFQIKKDIVSRLGVTIFERLTDLFLKDTQERLEDSLFFLWKPDAGKGDGFGHSRDSSDGRVV
jgi:hypothetical protein